MKRIELKVSRVFLIGRYKWVLLEAFELKKWIRLHADPLEGIVYRGSDTEEKIG